MLLYNHFTKKVIMKHEEIILISVLFCYEFDPSFAVFCTCHVRLWPCKRQLAAMPRHWPYFQSWRHSWGNPNFISPPLLKSKQFTFSNSKSKFVISYQKASKTVKKYRMELSVILFLLPLHLEIYFFQPNQFQKNDLFFASFASRSAFISSNFLINLFIVTI